MTMEVSPNCELDQLAEENRFLYNEELPSLQEMASCQAALAIWNGYTSRCSSKKWEIARSFHPPIIEVFGLYSTYRQDTNTLVDILKTPRSIETILKTTLDKIGKEMEQCVKCFFLNRILFCHYPEDVKFSTFKSHWCVWLPNGKIDYLKTAEMMVSPENNELNLKTKFAIMCEFYMEEKLKKFPLDSLPADFIKQLLWINIIDSTRYWIKYLSGDRSEEIDAYKMVAECILTDGMGSIRINHFWHRLNDDDQVKAVYYMLVKRCSFYCEKWHAAEPLIGSMSWDQQSRLLAMRQAGKTIIIFSCLYSSSLKCAIWAWKHCRDLITGHDFSTMIHEIIRSSEFYPSDDIEKDVFSAVVDVWDIACDHHRNTLVTDCQKLLGCMLHSQYSFCEFTEYSPAIYILLNKCLALKPVSERKALIMEFAVELAIGTWDTRYIQEILDLNLPHPDDIIKFKKSVTNSTNIVPHCVELWLNGDFVNLNASLEFYFSGDQNSIRECNQKLLSKITSQGSARVKKSVITDIDKWHECCKFIDQIFPDSPAKALVAKQQFVSCFLSFNCWSNYFCKHFDSVIKTIESVFQNKVELNRVKTKLTKAHPTPDDGVWMRKVLYNDVCYHIVIEWCCYDNEEAVIELKNKIQNQDTIFDIVFFQLNKAYLIEVAGLRMDFLTYLDKYLLWYLVSEDEIMDYKMRRLNESVNLSIFTTIRERRDEQSLKMLLGWFFDDDEAKVRDFRSKKMKF